MTELTISSLPIGSLKPYDRNARTHSAKQIAQIAASIKAFGFNNAVLIDKNNGIRRKVPDEREGFVGRAADPPIVIVDNGTGMRSRLIVLTRLSGRAPRIAG